MKHKIYKICFLQLKKNINWLVIKEKNEEKKPCLKIENFRIKNVVALCLFACDAPLLQKY